MSRIIQANPGYFVLHNLGDGTHVKWEIIAWYIKDAGDVYPITAEANYFDSEVSPCILHPDGKVSHFSADAWTSIDAWIMDVVVKN